MQRSKFLRVMGSFAAVAASFPLAGCGGGGGSDGTTDPTPAPPSPAPAPSPAPVARTFAYIANYESADISIYEVADVGSMTSVGTVTAGAGAHAIAIHPSGKFAYSVNELDENISFYALDPKTGLLTPSQSERAAAPSSNTIGIHPSGKFAYATNDNGESLSIYTVDPETGKLKPDANFPLGASPLSIAFHPSGSFLFVGLRDNRILSCSVDTTTGGLTLRNTVTEGRDAVGLAVSPSGKFLYVAAAESSISTRTINELGELGAAVSVNAAGVRSISIDASGRVICAVTGILDQSVSIYTVQDPQTGVPTFLASASLGPGSLNAAAISPTGRFVYAIMSNQDSGLGTLAAFEIDEGAGGLTEMMPSFATGIDPFGIRVVSISS